MEPPNAFLCPITRLLFVEPVVAADGHTYEKSAIQEWFTSNEEARSPMTGEPLPNNDKSLRLSHTLRSIIANWKEIQKVAVAMHTIAENERKIKELQLEEEKQKEKENITFI